MAWSIVFGFSMHCELTSTILDRSGQVRLSYWLTVD